MMRSSAIECRSVRYSHWKNKYHKGVHTIVDMLEKVLVGMDHRLLREEVNENRTSAICTEFVQMGDVRLTMTLLFAILYLQMP